MGRGHRPGHPGLPFALQYFTHSGLLLHRSCFQPGWHFYSGPSFPAKNRAGLSDPGSQPSQAVGGSLKTAGPLLEDSGGVLWRERHDQGESIFKKLLLSYLGSRQSMAQTVLCYSCRDNSFKGNADGRDGVIQRLKAFQWGLVTEKALINPGHLSIKQGRGLGRH